MIYMSELTKALKDCGALQFGDFTLASGAKSEYYIDIKKASTNPEVLYMFSVMMAEKMQAENIRPDRIAGVVLGSVPLAAALSLATSLDAFTVGVAFSLMEVPVLRAGGLTLLVMGALSILGAWFGGSVGKRHRKTARLAGGLILCILGFRLFWSALGTLTL